VYLYDFWGDAGVIILKLTKYWVRGVFRGQNPHLFEKIFNLLEVFEKKTNIPPLIFGVYKKLKTSPLSLLPIALIDFKPSKDEVKNYKLLR
jgi:hypothetical protein